MIAPYSDLEGMKRHICPDAPSVELGVDLFDYLQPRPVRSNIKARRIRQPRSITVEMPTPLPVAPYEIALFEAHFASFLDRLLAKDRSSGDKAGDQAD